ncbi:MAG: thiamine pyrophosphate-dependent enzyme [Blautia hydrogenotrophica]
MKMIYTKTKGLQDTELHYCPGCSHGIVHKLIGEVMEELNIIDDTIAVCPVGCSVFRKLFACDTVELLMPVRHRGDRNQNPPDQPVFTYQVMETGIYRSSKILCAMRGEKFTTIFINNGIYGMTGGQMAPTTLIGQRATTAPQGRCKELHGEPMRVSEMLATLGGLVYAERVCVTDVPNINKAKKALKKAFTKQLNNEGFTFVEVLCACPTNWGMTTLAANEWVKTNMAEYYPLGVIKEVTA